MSRAAGEREEGNNHRASARYRALSLSLVLFSLFLSFSFPDFSTPYTVCNVGSLQSRCDLNPVSFCRESGNTLFVLLLRLMSFSSSRGGAAFSNYKTAVKFSCEII